MIVDTYGIPRYKEINPSLFNIITFPMQFGVMFGDIFHGTLFFILGLILVCADHKINLGPFKYVVLQMGFWAMFMGFIYNDFSGLSLDLFGTCYPINADNKTFAYNREPLPNIENAYGVMKCIYPFGLDPVWLQSANSIEFYNSFKMKLAILLGVTQMMFGVLLKAANNIFYENYIDFALEFIPQIFFITFMFG